MSIKILVWIIQGVGNKVPIIRELIRINNPTVLVLVEIDLSGEQARKVYDKIVFSGQTSGCFRFFRGYLDVLES